MREELKEFACPCKHTASASSLMWRLASEQERQPAKAFQYRVAISKEINTIQ